MRFSPALSARRLARTAGAVALGVVLSACSFVTGIPDVDRVELTVPVTVIAPGQSVQASGQAFDGNSVVTHSRRQVRFTSSDDAVATVNSTSGLITGVAPGRATIRATSDDKSDEVQITVRPIPVRQVLIAQRSPVVRLSPSAVYVLSAAVIDTNNQQLGANRPVTWISRDAAVLTITAAGVVTPRAVGTTRVVASVDTGLAPNVGVVADSVTVRVTVPPILASGIQVSPANATLNTGQTQQYSVALTDSTNAVVTGRAVTWRSSNPNVATVDGSTGFVTAVAQGVASIIARVDQVPGETPLVPVENAATLTVVIAPAARVDASVSSVSLKLTNPGQLRTSTVGLTVRDANGNELLNRVVFVSTEPDPAVATVSITNNGVRSTATITAVGAGTTRVGFRAFRPGSNEPQGDAVLVDVTVAP